MVQQKPKALNQTNDSLQCTFASKDVWTKGYTVEYTVTHYSYQYKIFFYAFVFIGGGRAYKDRKQIRRDREMTRTGVHDMKFTKNQ